MTALYLERFMNYGITPRNCARAGPSSASRKAAATSARATASTWSWPSACATASATRAASDGIPAASDLRELPPSHRRLDRNLAYMGLVEILHGYPIDAVVLTTGCDKTTPRS
jgi:dihydroxy-acid dehydratase